MSTSPLIDCHAHVPAPQLARDAFLLKGILQRCARYRIETVNFSIDLSGEQPEVELAAIQTAAKGLNVKVVFSIGTAPPAMLTDAESLARAATAALPIARRLVKAYPVVAIGEVGLDYYWPVMNFLEAQGTPTPEARTAQWRQHFPRLKEEPAIRSCLAQQAQVFQAWLRLARELDLPLVIHERRAFEEVLAILESNAMDPARVMWHCFGSTPDNAVRLVRSGYWVSLPSSVTHREQYQAVARVMDLNHLLLETDSPYHSPIPGFWKKARQNALQQGASGGLKGAELDRFAREEHARRFDQAIAQELPDLDFEVRDGAATGSTPSAAYFRQSDRRQQNEPTFVRYAAPALAHHLACDPATVCAATTANARRLFRLQSSP